MRIVYELRPYGMRLMLSTDKTQLIYEFDPENAAYLTPDEVDDLIEALNGLRPHMEEAK